MGGRGGNICMRSIGNHTKASDRLPQLFLRSGEKKRNLRDPKRFWHPNTRNRKRLVSSLAFVKHFSKVVLIFNQRTNPSFNEEIPTIEFLQESKHHRKEHTLKDRKKKEN